MKNIQQKPREKKRINFGKSHPFEFALLNVTRKSIFINEHGIMTISRKFSINPKEFKIWGKIAKDKGLIRIESSKNRYRCLMNPGIITAIVDSIKNIKFEE